MDYNIYIHTVSQGGNESPTIPWQLKTTGNENGAVAGGEFSPSTAVKEGASFLRNPDSLIAGVMSTAIGKLGVGALIVKVIANITDKAITMYQSYAAPASGDYKFQIAYNNFKAGIQSVMHPFSTGLQAQMRDLQIRKENLANEQQRLLLGDSVINSQYGRYL